MQESAKFEEPNKTRQLYFVFLTLTLLSTLLEPNDRTSDFFTNIRPTLIYRATEKCCI